MMSFLLPLGAFEMHSAEQNEKSEQPPLSQTCYWRTESERAEETKRKHSRNRFKGKKRRRRIQALMIS